MVQPRLNIVGACERIVAEASRLAGENYAFNKKKKTGALDFITSPENAGVVVESGSLITHQNGRKLGKLHIYYDQRTKPCQISTDCDANVCDDGTTPVRKETDVTISNCISTPVRSYSAADMEALCLDPETFMQMRGFSDLIAAKEVLDVRLLAHLDAQIGKNFHFDGTETSAGNYKEITLIANDTNSQPIPLPGNWSNILLDWQNNQMEGVPAIIGQGYIEQFAKLHQMSCCNATTPYGEANINSDARFYLSQNGNAVLDDNGVIVTAFGIHHFLFFNENRLIQDVGNTPTGIHLVVPDPHGYPFDWNLDIIWDECNKIWKMQYSLMWGVFNIYQDDSFAGAGEDTSPDVSPDCADELDGMLGTFGYRVLKAS